MYEEPTRRLLLLLVPTSYNTSPKHRDDRRDTEGSADRTDQIDQIHQLPTSCGRVVQIVQGRYIYISTRYNILLYCGLARVVPGGRHATCMMMRFFAGLDPGECCTTELVKGAG